MILGVNGLIWIGWKQSAAVEGGNVGAAEIHRRIARAANVVRILAKLSLAVTAPRTSFMYLVSGTLAVLL